MKDDNLILACVPYNFIYCSDDKISKISLCILKSINNIITYSYVLTSFEGVVVIKI